MTKRSTTFLTCAAAVFVALSCGEPTGPVSEPQALPSFQTTLEEVTSTARTTGRHVVRNGNDVWVLDVSTGTVQINGGKKARVLQKDLPRLAEIFDRFASFDRFYEALHRDPEYLRCLEAGKKNPLRRATLKVTPISRGGQSAGLRMSSVGAVPTDGATQSTTITPIYLTGIDCESLNATWREQYAAYTQMKERWFQAMGESLVTSIGEDQFPNPLSDPDLTPLPTPYGYLQDLAVEAMALYAQLQMAEFAMNMTQVLMASYGCITTLPPVTIDGNAPTGGGGTGSCEVHLMQFLISYDNGATWHVVAEWYEYRNCD